MPNRLDLNVAEWKAAFLAEPLSLATAATPDVHAGAVAAAAEVRAAYHEGPTGNLKAGVGVLKDPNDRDPAKPADLVVSRAPHAHLYEDGTRYARANPTFYPITERHGRAMIQAVSKMVQARGYRVTGSVD